MEVTGTMSDQQRLLLASVLMAAVLVVGWNITSRRGRAPQEPAETSAAVDTTTGTGVAADTFETASDTTAAAEQPADSLEASGEGSASGEPAETPFEERTITVIIPTDGGVLVTGTLGSGGGAVTSWELEGYGGMLDGPGSEAIDLVAAPWFTDRNGAGEPVRYICESPDTVTVDSPTVVTFTAVDGTEKLYEFTPDEYAFTVRNGSGQGGTVLEPGAIPVTEVVAQPGRYFTAAWYAEKYRTAKTGGLEEERSLGRVLWAGARSQYFTVLLMPLEGERGDAFAFRGPEEESPGIRMLEDSVRVYAGPVQYGRLRALGSGTDRMVNFGWPIIRWIGQLIYLFLTSLLAPVGNWGVRIIILSAVMKAVMLPLSWHSAKSMRKMQALQPKMQELQKKYPNDPLRQRSELQKLYREQGVNPLGGCLPLVLQMPIFFALYSVLQSSIELRGAGFVLWITDLSRPEILIPFGTSVLGMNGIGLLAILMGAAMYFQQKMSMTDPSQKAMQVMMPVLMTWLFIKFPAGLTLYWFVNNVLSIAEQQMVRRSRREAATAAAT
jgi:YidC/Oxa1 family membrane protein insertase